MKFKPKEFYYISHAHDTIVVSLSLPHLKERAHPILWNNKGLFCIISRQKVQNMLDVIKDTENLPVLNKMGLPMFHWDEGILIDARVAAMLLS